MQLSIIEEVNKASSGRKTYENKDTVTSTNSPGSCHQQQLDINAM